MTMLVANAQFLFVGAALGALHFEALGWNVSLFAAPRARWMAVGVLIGRITITTVAFVLLARLGALPLILAAAGFVAIRPVFVHPERSPP